jgi:hypothetical protein
MDANVQLSDSQNAKPLIDDKNIISSKPETDKLSYGAFGRLARILADIAENPVPTKEPQKANVDE